jgi:KRAB domain-containing zinc finger protein
MRSHKETRVKCTLCDRNYKSKDYLKYHMKTIHHGNVKYNCQYCPKTFTSWGGHRNHTHLKHYKVNPDLKCGICNKCFPSSFSLRFHLRWHNKKKSYQCKVCSQTFSNSTSLKLHNDTQHLNTKWTCDICGQTWNNKRQLQLHIKKHLGRERNYECPVCSKLFAQNVVMRTHVEKLHPDEVHLLPPKGTVVNKKALEQQAIQRDIEEQYVKIDFEEINEHPLAKKEVQVSM